MLMNSISILILGFTAQLVVVCRGQFRVVDGNQLPLPEERLKQNSSTEQLVGQRKNVICHYGNYAAMRQGRGKLLVDDINPMLCTHIIYASMGFNDKFEMESEAPDVDLDSDGGLGSIKKLAKLKERNTSLKTLISIGGSSVYSDTFSSMAKRPESRDTFTRNVVQFLDDYQLDGVDIDWQYPAQFGGDSEDKKNYALLLAQLRAALKPAGKILSAQVAAVRQLIDAAYDIEAIAKELDLINLMAYDYEEVRARKTVMLAPIFSLNQSLENQEANVNWSIGHWIASGAPANKLHLIISLYGQTSVLDDPKQTGFGAPAAQPGSPGPYTKLPGLMGYNEICSLVNRQRGRWTVVTDRLNQAYAYRNRRWFGFEDVRSVGNKAFFARQRDLGGVMLYSVDTDDFSGRCHGLKFPLTMAAKHAVNGLGAFVLDVMPGAELKSLNQSILSFPLPADSRKRKPSPSEKKNN